MKEAVFSFNIVDLFFGFPVAAVKESFTLKLKLLRSLKVALKVEVSWKSYPFFAVYAPLMWISTSLAMLSKLLKEYWKKNIFTKSLSYAWKS